MESLRGLSHGDRLDRLVKAVHAVVVDVLGRTADDVDIDMPLDHAVGTDVVGLISELQWVVGGAMRVSPGLLSEHPTVELIAEHFEELLFGAGSVDDRSMVTFSWCTI